MITQIPTIISILLEKNLEFLLLMGSAGMLWWVSGTSFCLALFKTLYPVRDTIRDRTLFLAIGIYVSILIASMLGYGLSMAYLTNKLYLETNSLLLNIDISLGYYARLMFRIIHVSFIVGSSSFILFLLVWLHSWFIDKNEIKKLTNS